MESDDSTFAELVSPELEYHTTAENTIKSSPGHGHSYTALDRHAQQIRLLSLSWDNEADTLRCRLETYLLAEAPHYTSLSYTWGKHDPDCTVLLGSGTIKVTRNLKRFLHQVVHLRKYCSRRYWIDAICIDQSSTTERTHQVGFMANIYSKAHDILVWLGPAHSGSDGAMRSLQKPYRQEVWSSATGSYIRLLCERAYWTRLRDLHWPSFAQFVSDAIQRKPDAPRADTRSHAALVKTPAVSMISNVRQSQHTRARALFNQVLSLKHLGCASPHDRVYALLGIAESGNENIEPNYAIHYLELLHNVLRDHHRVVKPASLDVIITQCTSLSTAARLSPKAMLSYIDHGGDLISPSIVAREGTPYYGMAPPEFVEDVSGLLMFWWASYHDFPHVEDLWREHVPEARRQELFIMAVRQGQHSLVKYVLDCDLVDVNLQTSDRISPLHASITGAWVDITALLLDHPAIDVNARSVVRLTNNEDSYQVRHSSCDSVLVTPLLAAVALVIEDIVLLLLLLHGRIDVNAPEHFDGDLFDTVDMVEVRDPNTFMPRNTDP